MSTVLTCQDHSFVGGQSYNCLYRAQTSTDNVDVTTETQASFWAPSPTEDTCQHESLENITGLSCGTSPDSVRTEHMSPHQRRNKQLQDTLIQRDEELARLQEENNKLKEFLNCSYVQNLEEQAKRLRSAHKNRKRAVQVDKALQSLSTSQLIGSQVKRNLSTSQLIGSQVKRTCRNLSLEFCSSEDVASSPYLDHWILQTLGLKDADTIDTSAGYTSIPSFHSACTRSPNNEDSDHPCQAKSQDTANYSSVIGSSPSIEPSTNYIPAFDTISNYTCSTESYSDIIAGGLSVQSSPRVTATPIYQVSPIPPSPLPQLIGDPLSPQTRQRFTPVAASSSARLHHTPSPQCQNFTAPLADPDSLPCAHPSSPCQPSPHRHPPPHCQRSTPCQPSPHRHPPPHCQRSTPCQPSPHRHPPPHCQQSTPCQPSPRGQPDVAFTMSLSSSSSVRTHSFHQGQAFVRRHSQGGWSFTWVPIQAS